MTALAKYETLKYLGKGSYGSALLVCLKEDREQKYVMKEIVIGHLKTSEQESALKESEFLQTMAHSNIVSYIESFQDRHKLFIVMEYADGGDLTQAISRRSKARSHWTEEEAMRIFVQICLALSHIHAKNVLHRLVNVVVVL